jgi:hypothetical protein
LGHSGLADLVLLEIFATEQCPACFPLLGLEKRKHRPWGSMGIWVSTRISCGNPSCALREDRTACGENAWQTSNGVLLAPWNNGQPFLAKPTRSRQWLLPPSQQHGLCQHAAPSIQRAQRAQEPRCAQHPFTREPAPSVSRLTDPNSYSWPLAFSPTDRVSRSML